MPKSNIFADRIVNISVHNGVVRMELGTMDAPAANDKKAATLDVTHRLVMPIEGFVASVRIQQSALKAMAERGKKERERAEAGAKEKAG